MAKSRVPKPLQSKSSNARQNSETSNFDISFFVYGKACLSCFHTHKSACKLSLVLLSYRSSKIAISRVKRGVTPEGWSGLQTALDDALRLAGSPRANDVRGRERSMDFACPQDDGNRVCGLFITNRSARASKDRHCIFGLQTSSHSPGPRFVTRQ